MAQQNDHVSLQAIWRALSGEGKGNGWRTIAIEPGKRYGLLVGRHFPGDEESILVGFGVVRIPPDNHLPQGHGFNVEKVDQKILGAGRQWVSLYRKADGNLDMFSRMAEDIIDLLRRYENVDDGRLFQLFLGRIRAWQEFMEHGRCDVLGLEAEVGLFGEISLFKAIIETQVPLFTVLKSWHGPLHGLQDFLLGTGAIEVKSTIAKNGFPAKVGSIEQLDDSVMQPLFVAGIKLALDDSGKSLPEFILEIRGLLDSDPMAQGMFDNLILQAGFLWGNSENYIRRFSQRKIMILKVDDNFPRLIHGNINKLIRKARYEIDLDMVEKPELGLDQVLQELGVI